LLLNLGGERKNLSLFYPLSPRTQLEKFYWMIIYCIFISGNPLRPIETHTNTSSLLPFSCASQSQSCVLIRRTHLMRRFWHSELPPWQFDISLYGLLVRHAIRDVLKTVRNTIIIARFGCLTGRVTARSTPCSHPRWRSHPLICSSYGPPSCVRRRRRRPCPSRRFQRPRPHQRRGHRRSGAAPTARGATQGHSSE